MTQPLEPNPRPATNEQTPIPNSGADPELSALQSQMLQLQAQGENGAGWFYWVAGLSLINSVIALVGGNMSFVVGLAITRVVDDIAWSAAAENPELTTIAKAASFGFAVLVAVVVAGFGWLSNKRIIPVFALGILLYALDGALYVLTQDWLCVAFHAFALFNMWQGLVAYRRLSAILRTSPAVT